MQPLGKYTLFENSKSFSMKSLKIVLFGLTLGLIPIALSAQTLVQGKVTSADGEDLIGATVLELETQNGALVDENGNFEINVSSLENTLQFSYTGYQVLEVEIAGRTTIDVSMQEARELLDEVVVIAYGATTKRKFTGSLTSVSSKEIESIPQASTAQMLQGRAPGVYINDDSGSPGTAGSIVIRGVGTLGSATGPLIVIDGTPTAGLADLNSNDIASISVLKDASAASIYGSRAANGVVLITTKQGSTGKTKFKLSAQYGFTEFENPNNFRVLNAQEYTDVYRSAAISAGFDPDDPEGGFYFPLAPSTSTDWLDAVTQTGTTQQYELSATGGSEKTNHFISASYFNQNGPIISPGQYKVVLNTNGQTMEQIVEILIDPKVKQSGVTIEDLKAQETLCIGVTELLSKANLLAAQIDSALTNGSNPTKKDQLEALYASLVRASGRYTQPMLISQIDYLLDLLDQADQAPGKDAQLRYSDLKDALEEINSRFLLVKD